VFALVYGVSNAETHSWTATVTIVALAASVVLLTGFVLIERGVRMSGSSWNFGGGLRDLTVRQ
jgi:preprotein translocase subunit SecG